MENKKFLDQIGLEYLWSKISIKDYPNNETLIAILNAIDETKADTTYVDDEISKLGGKPILTDTTTGINYELYVENGKLSMKETDVLGGKAILKDSITGISYELYVENSKLTMKEAE